MALITPPAAMPIRRIEWTLRQPHQVNRSGWTGRRQVTSLPGGSWWSCSAEFAPVTGQAAARKWRGFFNALEGQLHRFPMVAVESAQHAGGNPAIVSGAAGAKTLQLSAAPPALQAGDFMTVKLSDGSHQLVVLTAAIAGTTASFAPGLRLTAATGAGSIETILPFAHVSLTADSFRYAVDRGQIYTFAFEADESF
ncbi:MAG: hypothetical protein WCZ28_11410 [Burkholderiaceae bacterium]